MTTRIKLTSDQVDFHYTTKAYDACVVHLLVGEFKQWCAAEVITAPADTDTDLSEFLKEMVVDKLRQIVPRRAIR